MSDAQKTPDDVDLRIQLRDLLLSRSDLWVESLDVECRAGDVIIAGQAPSFYVKQLVQTVAMRVIPGASLRNEIVVVPSE